MMKFLSNKEMNKLTKISLTLVLAGTFTFSTTNAFATEGETSVDQGTYQTVELPNNHLKNTLENNLNEESSIVNNEDLKGTKAPSLVPGNFFYFAKVAFEKTKLAFTINQEKEAKILAEYAAERLAEAEVLFKNGKQKEATELIEKAIENISNVDKDNVDVVIDDKEDSLKEVNFLLSQNIIALKAALEKVENPVARAAIQKNIEKSYARLAKKMAKIEKKYDLKKEEQENKVEPKINNENSSNGNTVVVPVSSAKELKEELEKQKKSLHEQDKIARELAKKEEKANREQDKREEKTKREESKKQWKELKEKEKQERKEYKHNEKHKAHEYKPNNYEEKGSKGENRGNNNQK